MPAAPTFQMRPNASTRSSGEGGPAAWSRDGGPPPTTPAGRGRPSPCRVDRHQVTGRAGIAATLSPVGGASRTASLRRRPGCRRRPPGGRVVDRQHVEPGGEVGDRADQGIQARPCRSTWALAIRPHVDLSPTRPLPRRGCGSSRRRRCHGRSAPCRKPRAPRRPPRTHRGWVRVPRVARDAEGVALGEADRPELRRGRLAQEHEVGPRRTARPPGPMSARRHRSRPGSPTTSASRRRR